MHLQTIQWRFILFLTVFKCNYKSFSTAFGSAHSVRNVPLRNLATFWADDSDSFEYNMGLQLTSQLLLREQISSTHYESVKPDNIVLVINHGLPPFPNDQSLLTTISQWPVTDYHWFPLTNLWLSLFLNDQSLITVCPSLTLFVLHFKLFWEILTSNESK